MESRIAAVRASSKLTMTCEGVKSGISGLIYVTRKLIRFPGSVSIQCLKPIPRLKGPRLRNQRPKNNKIIKSHDKWGYLTLFKNKLDKFWGNQDLIYGYKAELTRSFNNSLD